MNTTTALPLPTVLAGTPAAPGLSGATIRSIRQRIAEIQDIIDEAERAVEAAAEARRQAPANALLAQGPLLTVPQVAELLGVCEATTWRLLNASETPIPSIKIGTARRVASAALEAWIAEREAASPRASAVWPSDAGNAPRRRRGVS